MLNHLTNERIETWVTGLFVIGVTGGDCLRDVLLRENCVVGIPRFPHSCSMATTNLADRLINVTQSAFAEFGDGFGLA